MFPLRDTIPSRHFPYVNYGLIALNLLAFFVQVSVDYEYVVYTFGMIPLRFTSPEVYGMERTDLGVYLPFFTNMFLHGGIGHILGNLWTLYIFGDNVEDRMGKGGYLLFYLLCGVLASGTHYWLSPLSEVPAIGASGAISGVMGAYMFLFPKSRILMLIPILFIPWFFEISAFVYLGFWFLLQLFSGWQDLSAPGDMGGVAFWAHIGGFVAGVLLFRLFLWRPPAPPEPPGFQKYPRHEVRSGRPGSWY